MATTTRRTPTKRRAAPTRGRTQAVRRGPRDAVERYARRVVDGKELAGWLVRAACERHLRDLERKDLVWDRAAAEYALGYFPTVLRLNGGEHEGVPFVLHPSQEFIVGSLFGWKSPDGWRRFRVAYIEKAKGGGKSPLAAGIGLYMLHADKEPRSEVYAAAVHKEQASVLFRDAVAFVRQSPSLSRRVDISGPPGREWNLAHLKSGSFFRPISSENMGRGKSGPRPHCAILDEVHEHYSSAMVDFMRAGTKGRRQALVIEITNSGWDPNSVWGQHHDYSIKVMERVYENDAWFAYVCSLDPCDACRAAGMKQPKDDCAECDDWRDERVWRKANPLLGISVTEKYLREQVREAEGIPAKANLVKRLNFCMQAERSGGAIAIELWDQGAAAIDVEGLRGRRCFGGLDLGRTNDLSAFLLLFPPAPPGETEDPDNPPERWKALLWCWCPEEDIVTRSREHGVPYELWEREGLLEATPGGATDYDVIGERVKQLSRPYEVVEIGYDATFAHSLAQHLADHGFTMVEIAQSHRGLGAASAELLRLLKAGEFQHGGNVMLRWAASNLHLSADAGGNLKPDKERSKEKIDPISALVNALSCAIAPRNASESNWTGTVHFSDDEPTSDDAEGYFL